MIDNIEELFALLSRPENDVTEQDRTKAAYAAHVLIHSWSHLNPAHQTTVTEFLISLKETSSPYKGAMVNSMLFGITGEAPYLAKALASLEHYETDITAGVSTFFSLALMNFKSNPVAETAVKKHLTRDVLRQLFLKNLAKVQDIFNIIKSDTPPKFEKNNRVIILTRQMLRPPHAPSVDTLDFAAMLKQDHGKEPLIIATSEASHSYDGAIAPCFLANIDEDFIDIKTINYRDQQLPFLMCGKGVFSVNSVAEGLATIAAYNPEMILSVGSPSLLSEPFGDSRFCFIYPTSRGIPTTSTNYFHTWDEVDEEMQQQIEDEGHEAHYLFTQHPGFELKPPSSSLTRAQFGIPEDSFVFVVVGLRLDNDVDDSFVTLLDTLVEHTKAHIIFAGPFNTYDTCMEGHDRLKEKSTPLGFQPDIMAVYALADAFLNPTRKGAGSGIIYAMQALLPILSLPHGDAGMAVAGFPALSSYDDMADAAKKLIDDPEILQQYQEIAKSEFPKFTGRTRLVSRILEEFEKYASKKLEA
ncbi:MAG: glycosyltransferase [Kordiimonadaceae bacterium]|nr:glycosyltransferase [Kordiimonadaceae bacterium]